MNARYLITRIVLGICLAKAAFAAGILVGNEKSRPESLTVAPGGILIVGSASSPFVYKVRPGSSTAEKFIDVSAEGPGTSFLGMLADVDQQYVMDLSTDNGSECSSNARAERAARFRSHKRRSQAALEPPR